MAVTLRTLMDRILRPLGETEVGSAISSLSSAYHKLLLTFINQIKEEVEDAHQWRALRQLASCTITAGQYSGIITGANDRSRLLYVPSEDGFVPLIFDVTNSTQPYNLPEQDLARWVYDLTLDPVTSVNAQPSYTALDNTSGDVLKLCVFPKATTDRNYKVGLVVPQTWLEPSDLDVVIQIPTRPILQGALWYAFTERGEEQGQNGAFSEERYRQAVDDAISRDAAAQGDAIDMLPV
jgi:hypothetical protein